MMDIDATLNNPAFRLLFLYLTTAFGAATMHIFSMTKGFEGSVTWLRKMWPDRSDAFYHRLDFVLIVVFGSVVGFTMFYPTEAYRALAAGFGWVSAVTVITNKSPLTGERK